ncbi:hypothetical protein G9272_37275 [Streptomyces asoensis]|uniref:DUF4386 domain-containing protein n=1 Tax=Streptomyces asoensis TaxID=249586 RepID=A0A6M4X0B6_9ACTN|nr:hypothetical protein [Streptomyces asoensis]QJT05261.1 hypothetical protein G9272_37275 [Streptomyces asoensis]
MQKAHYIRLERVSVWCGVVLMVGFLAAFAIGHITPPMSPTESPEDIVTFLKDHRTGILTCVALMVLLVPFEYPYVVVTSLQLRRVEGGWGLLSMIQLTTGVVAPLGFFFPLAILAAAAYRPGLHSADVLSAMTDMFWLMFVGNACIFVLQVWSIGYASFIDHRAEPIFPRWYGWLSMLLGVLLIPGAFVFLNQTGPLAWNGLLAYALPSVAYFIWKIATPWVLLQAVRSEEKEIAETAEARPVTV